jgi:hypothetical protein
VYNCYSESGDKGERSSNRRCPLSDIKGIVLGGVKRMANAYLASKMQLAARPSLMVSLKLIVHNSMNWTLLFSVYKGETLGISLKEANRLQVNVK